MRIFFTVSLVFSSVLLIAQSYLSKQSLIKNIAIAEDITIRDIHSFSLNPTAFLATLKDAPLEFSTSYRKSKTIIYLPLPDGSNQAFHIVESPVMGEKLSTKYSKIKSYKGIAVGNERITTRFDINSTGLHAAVSTPKGTVYIEPIADKHIAYYTKDVALKDAALAALGCGNKNRPTKESQATASNDDIIESRQLSELDLRTYRFALTCTGEYGASKGGTVEKVLETFVTATNRMNFIYEREAGIRFVLVDSIEQLIFVNGNDDPYLNAGDGRRLLGEAPTRISGLIGADAYDISHVFTNSCGTGGIASLQGLCNNSQTRSGVTCHYRNFDYIISNVMSHEMGHQFSAQHTMSNCGDTEDQNQNIASNNTYEPGSGSTIMSYAGVCANFNLQSGSDEYFHIHSLIQVIDYSRERGGSTCPTIVDVNNNEPTIELPYEDDFFIPISTPFELTASASDIDNDNLTYCWEQYDLGEFRPVLGSPQGSVPTFRSYPPVASPTRIFPRLSVLLSNEQENTEVLPTYSRDLTFRCTVRDNNAEGAGAAIWSEVKFRSDESAGPFLVTRPNGMVNAWKAGGYYAVQWDVANTTNRKVNCQRVNIKLSLDGGNTFPIVLAEDVLNDGEQFVTIPDVISTQARIRVEAANNIFFDISNDNFNITSPTEPTLAVQVTPFYQKVCLPNVIDIQIDATGLQGFNEPVNLSVRNLPAGLLATFEPATIEVGQSSNLTIELNEAGIIGLQEIELLAITATDTLIRPIEIELISNDFSDFTLRLPADNTRDIFGITTFAWADVPNAESYDFQIATSPAFGSSTIFAASSITTDSIRPDIFLEDNTIYFWRVRPRNECGASDFTIPRAFQTINVQCQPFAQETPLQISGSGTPMVESIIKIEQEGTISDLNIPIVVGGYQPVRFVEVSLISPAGTQAILFDNLCGSTSNFNLGFDDDAPDAITCPPTAGIVQRPLESLAIFNGESIKGEWKMRFRVREAGFGAGGSIERWALESCGSLTLNAPFLVTNDTLFTPPSLRSQIWIETLQAEDEDNSSDEIIYEIVATPNHGVLYQDEQVLSVGDTFTQQDIDGFRIAYEHDGSESTNDQFYFIIRDVNGGWLGTPAFNIAIREDATVNTSELELAKQIDIYPNPTSEIINIDLSKIVDEVQQIEIYDLNGQLLRSIQTIQVVNQLRIEEFSSGLYLVQVRTKETVYTAKVVVE